MQLPTRRQLPRYSTLILTTLLIWTQPVSGGCSGSQPHHQWPSTSAEKDFAIHSSRGERAIVEVVIIHRQRGVPEILLRMRSTGLSSVPMVAKQTTACDMHCYACGEPSFARKGRTRITSLAARRALAMSQKRKRRQNSIVIRSSQRDWRRI